MSRVKLIIFIWDKGLSEFFFEWTIQWFQSHLSKCNYCGPCLWIISVLDAYAAWEIEFHKIGPLATLSLLRNWACLLISSVLNFLLKSKGLPKYQWWYENYFGNEEFVLIKLSKFWIRITADYHRQVHNCQVCTVLLRSILLWSWEREMDGLVQRKAYI